MSQQVDPQAAVHMAQQEMEYRVDLFNKCVFCTHQILNSNFLYMTYILAEWYPPVMTNALTKGVWLAKVIV